MTFLIFLYLLEIVGACAVTALGWAACRVLQIASWPSLPLWLAGYLLVYNVDRLYLDPADRLNTPARTTYRRQLRPFRLGVILASGLIISIWPIMTGRPWLTIALLFVALGLQFYSRPIPRLGRRLKDLPYLKSLLAPLFIAAVLVLWPALENRLPFNLATLTVFSWSFCLLTMNSLVFDYRDISGDRMAKTRTIPATLGKQGTTVILVLLSVTLVGLSAQAFAFRPESVAMPVALGSGSVLLLVLMKRSQEPMILSLMADLLLFIPPLVEILR